MVLSYILGHTVKVVSDDSDVFVVLVHFYSPMKCVTPVNIISPIHHRAMIDIRATRIEHSVIADDIFAIHAISVSSYLGIGKVVHTVFHSHLLKSLYLIFRM